MNVTGVTRRVNFIDFYGDKIRSFRDDTGICIWVSLRDLLTNIGIRLVDEHERIKKLPELEKEMQISLFRAYLPSGEGVSELFIPHNRVNRYLFSFPIGMAPSDAVRGNLLTYQDEFIVALNRYWTDLEGSAVSYSPLELRRAVIDCSLQDLRREIVSLGDLEEDEIDTLTIRCTYFLRDILNCADKHTGQMTAVELDAYSLMLTLLRSDIRQNHIPGAAIDDILKSALVNAKKTVQNLPAIRHCSWEN